MALHGEYAPGSTDWARRQADEYEASGGTRATKISGKPVVILTSVGARTGMLRKTAVMRVEHEGIYAAVASLSGAPKHPSWYWNLIYNPTVELQDRAERHDYMAREVGGNERAVWWRRAVEVWPDYDLYQSRTPRIIPVFVLERIDPGFDVR